MTLKFLLDSGAKLEFNIAPIEPSINLFHAILNEAKKADLDLTVANETTFMDLIMQNKSVVLNLFASQDVQNAIIDCCNKVIYNNEHFSLSLFEKVENRKDFYGILTIVAMETIRPFFPQALTYFQPIANLFLK